MDNHVSGSPLLPTTVVSNYLSLAQINGNVRGSQQTTQGID